MNIFTFVGTSLLTAFIGSLAFSQPARTSASILFDVTCAAVPHRDVAVIS